MKLTRLSKGQLVVDMAAFLDSSGWSAAKALLLAVKRAERAGTDVRDAVVQVLKERGALVENVKYIIIDDQPLKSLPADRIKYADKYKHAELRELNPVEFLKSQYENVIERGDLYHKQLAAADPQLLKAVRNHADRNPESRAEVKRILKTRSAFVRERVELGEETHADDELARDLKTMAYYLNRPRGGRARAHFAPIS